MPIIQPVASVTTERLPIQANMYPAAWPTIILCGHLFALSIAVRGRVKDILLGERVSAIWRLAVFGIFSRRMAEVRQTPVVRAGNIFCGHKCPECLSKSSLQGTANGICLGITESFNLQVWDWLLTFVCVLANSQTLSYLLALILAEHRPIYSPAVRASNKTLATRISDQTLIIIAGEWCWLRKKAIFTDPEVGDRILAFCKFPCLSLCSRPLPYLLILDLADEDLNILQS